MYCMWKICGIQIHRMLLLINFLYLFFHLLNIIQIHRMLLLIIAFDDFVAPAKDNSNTSYVAINLRLWKPMGCCCSYSNTSYVAINLFLVL